MLNIFFSLSTDFLCIALYNNNDLIKSFQKLNHKLHSDNFLFYLRNILENSNKKLKEIDAIYFTYFPGGETGKRITISFLITLQTINSNLKFYHINTLLFQCGNEKKCLSILKINKNKYYISVIKNDKFLLENKILLENELDFFIKKFYNFLIKKDFLEINFLKNYEFLKEKFSIIKDVKDLQKY